MKVFQERGITHLDLHGVKHQDVEDEVLDFIYQHQTLLPLIVVCGNSNKMIEIVSTFLDLKTIGYSHPFFGIIRVESIS